WGPRAPAKKVVEFISEFLLSKKSDTESTSPFPMQSCLSVAENNIRTAVILANEQIYRQENREEYHAGFEIFVASWVGGEFSWVQIGQPHLCLWRKDFPIFPCGLSPDHSFDLSRA